MQRPQCGRRCARSACFNPHPARRPDATLCRARWCAAQIVSILIRPEGRMQQGWKVWQAGDRSVSILIRPEGRMQLSSPHPPVSGMEVSILIRPEGRMQPRWHRRRRQQGLVSILIRPEGRMQRPLFVHSLVHRVGFNPHPARRPDATSATNQVDLRVYPLFQSSSGQKAGCNNYAAEGDGAVHRAVSILIRPEGRMQHDKG